MAKSCEEKPPIGVRKLAANRANAKKSTGPKTKAGKERSRRNSLQHGMRSETDLLPNELDAKVQTAITGWKDQLRPEGAVELTLVQQAARCSCKLEWLDKQFNAVVTRQVRAAGEQFDTDEFKAARLESKTLVADPAGTLEILRMSVAGCDWLLAEWKSLLESRSDPWTETQTAHALRLSGIDPTQPVADDLDRSFSESRIQEVIAELRQLRATNNTSVDGELRAESQASAMIPQGKWGGLWPRYQGIAMKGYHQAIHDLIKIRKLDDPPRPNDFRRPSGDDAPNEPTETPKRRYCSTNPEDFEAMFGAALEQSGREKRKLTAQVEQLSLQVELGQVQLRALERDLTKLGRRVAVAPNEPTESTQVPVPQAGSVKRPSLISQAIQAAAIFFALLATLGKLGDVHRGGRGAGRAGKIQEFKIQEFKIQESRIQDSRIQDSRIQEAKTQDAKTQDATIRDSRRGNPGIETRGR